MPIIQRSIVFTKQQMKWLKDEAKRIGITVGELVRRIVDEKRDRKV